MQSIGIILFLAAQLALTMTQDLACVNMWDTNVAGMDDAKICEVPTYQTDPDVATGICQLHLNTKEVPIRIVSLTHRTIPTDFPVALQQQVHGSFVKYPLMQLYSVLQPVKLAQ